ncbi:13545_t:CDS:2 [Funneliformis geosporum]|uniref:13545_t:CDS:1 n=1 Tax=Funneliformis geosporum TaxID=1117311 RepID=A0A9W4WPH8_9GLOM|nr:13545_t:CDS:2 [Funneliformis geosporum]
MNEDDLLNDPQIKNSTLPKEEEQNTPLPPKPKISLLEITFDINQVERAYSNGSHNFTIKFEETFIFQEKKIEQIIIKGSKIDSFSQQGKLEVGKRVVISGIKIGKELSLHTANIFNSDGLCTLKINNDDSFAEIKSVTSTYGGVSAKNEALWKEENSLDQLAIELLDIIEKNKQICQEAQTLGLNLPTISNDVLKPFQQVFFKEFNDKLPLDNPINRDVDSANQNVRQQKMNIKANVYRIYDRNIKALTDAKKNEPSVPNNELEKLKNKVMVAINEVLSDNNNLQNINLTTFENGEYLN